MTHETNTTTGTKNGARPAAKAGMTGETGSGPSSDSVLVTGIVNSTANTGAAWLRQIWTLTLLASVLLPHYPFATRGFRPSF